MTNTTTIEAEDVAVAEDVQALANREAVDEERWLQTIWNETRRTLMESAA